MEQFIALCAEFPQVLQMCWLRQLPPKRQEPLFQNLQALFAVA